MNIPRKMIEAGAIGIANSQWYDWGNLPEASTFEVDRRDFMEHATAAIRAAIGCAEVVRTNNTTTDESVDVQTWCEESVGDVCPLHPGDTLLILRAGGEVENG